MLVRKTVNRSVTVYTDALIVGPSAEYSQYGYHSDNVGQSGPDQRLTGMGEPRMRSVLIRLGVAKQH